MGDNDLSHVTSIRELVIARAHVTIFPRQHDTETWGITGGWCIIKLSIQFGGTGVTAFIEVQIQLAAVKSIHMVNHIEKSAGTSGGFEGTASFVHKAHVGTIRF